MELSDPLTVRFMTDGHLDGTKREEFLDAVAQASRSSRRPGNHSGNHRQYRGIRGSTASAARYGCG
jgi:hypothetical protein